MTVHGRLETLCGTRTLYNPINSSGERRSQPQPPRYVTVLAQSPCVTLHDSRTRYVTLRDPGNSLCDPSWPSCAVKAQLLERPRSPHCTRSPALHKQTFHGLRPPLKLTCLGVVAAAAAAASERLGQHRSRAAACRNQSAGSKEEGACPSRTTKAYVSKAITHTHTHSRGARGGGAGGGREGGRWVLRVTIMSSSPSR